MDNNHSYTYTEDADIKSLSNFDPEQALSLAKKRFKENEWRDLGDYKQLMYIYLDLWEYKQVIQLGKIALGLMSKYEVEKIGVHAILSKIVQAYLFSTKIHEAERLIETYKSVAMGYENLILQYMKKNYQYIINNREEIEKDKRHYVWAGLWILAKTYDKLWDTERSAQVHEDIWNYGATLQEEHPLLETYYWYISSRYLLSYYKQNNNPEKVTQYERAFLKFQKRIEDEEYLTFWGKEIRYNKKLMYFNIDRISNL